MRVRTTKTHDGRIDGWYLEGAQSRHWRKLKWLPLVVWDAFLLTGIVWNASAHGSGGTAGLANALIWTNVVVFGLYFVARRNLRRVEALEHPTKEAMTEEAMTEDDRWYVTVQIGWNRRGNKMKYAYVFNHAGYQPIPGAYRYASAEAAHKAGERLLKKLQAVMAQADE